MRWTPAIDLRREVWLARHVRLFLPPPEASRDSGEEKIEGKQQVTMVFCFICDDKRKVKNSQPATEVCANCGESATHMELQDVYRFCFVPVFWRSHHEIMCNKCEWRSTA